MFHKLSLKTHQSVSSVVTAAAGSSTATHRAIHSYNNNSHYTTLVTKQQQHKQHTHNASHTNNKYKYGLLGTTTALSAGALLTAYDNNDESQRPPRLFPTAYADSGMAPDALPVVPPPQQYGGYAPTTGGLNTVSDDLAPLPVKRSTKLKNPGKFDHAHRESQSVLSVNVHPGASFRFAQPMYMGTDEERATGMFEKQMTFLPALMFGGQEGSSGQMHVITQLGQQHEFRGMMDNAFNLTGKYKHTSANKKWSQKAEFILAPQQNGLTFAADYKGRDYTAQFNIVQMQELTLSYSQALTSRISAGTELTHVLGMMTFLAGQLRYYDELAGVQAAATYKVGSLHASYARAVSPTLSLATEMRYNTMNKESMFQVGMMTRRPNSFTYQAAIQSNLTTIASLEIPLVPGIAFEINGAMTHDGSNESTFGFGLSIG